ncbi:DUF6351 family protein [Rugamonas sp. CCM 8940]|uniref:DUF6351 family protein n=1 Tax=Rugamonas sp. CCM 8940 TaxID=2765359 RepID=UPI0018F60E4C|nr:DUF6351 family protein [Rugamonas sp. CCM 8940]MBJ7309590.1 hypothetical protein [Rugamonas sp. CCM 8940]
MASTSITAKDFMMQTIGKRQARLVFGIAVAIATAGCAAAPPHPPRVTLGVLSSAAELVSGGDARIEVVAPPELLDHIAFWLNGKPVAPTMVRHGDRMEGVVSGLRNGENQLQARHTQGARGRDVLDTLTLSNHPLSGPLFTGAQQQPFICRSQESGLGQPLVDNQDGIGHPVFDPAGGQLLGHSQYCNIANRIGYFYFNGSGFKPFDPATGYANPPADLTTTTLNGAALPFVVRVEAGSINRFLYTIAMLAPTAVFDQSAWNRKLVYWLRGGVGIGHQQGTAMWFNNGLSGSEVQLMPRILAQGYAVLSSSGNEAGVQYNMRLAEETALMTKEHFIKAYGKPRYTIGLGGSGGAVQQYLFAQNRPGLLDGGVPVQSFPDMVTQTTPISDCPLLGQYFHDAVALDPASPWATWSKQRLIEGMNASDSVPNAIFGKLGTTECINGWRMAILTVLNPWYKDGRYAQAAALYRYPPEAFANVKWTHWNDLANIYGTDRQGFAPNTIDNVGVQYGLGALAQGQIDADEFLRINACVGGWKEQADFVAWDEKGDPFDGRNMRRGTACRDPAGVPAQRRAADVSAIAKAFSSGHVFTGRRLDIPLIDLRPYLEAELNMHNARQSFSARARMLDANPAAARNQVIWVIGSNNNALAAVMQALSVVDRYLGDAAAPAEFTDQCIGADGATIAAGAAVWDGILNQNPPGACSSAYPIFSSPRMVAGESIKGDIFKCALKPVASALADGTYAAGTPFSAGQKAWLHKIFPDGVCDYAAAGWR